MNTLVWHAHQWARRLGRTGLAGLALGIAAALIQLAHTAPLQAETDALQVRLLSLQATPKREIPRVSHVAASGFIDNLPPTAAASAVIGQLELLARTSRMT